MVEWLTLLTRPRRPGVNPQGRQARLVLLICSENEYQLLNNSCLRLTRFIILQGLSKYRQLFVRINKNNVTLQFYSFGWALFSASLLDKLQLQRISLLLDFILFPLQNRMEYDKRSCHRNSAGTQLYFTPPIHKSTKYKLLEIIQAWMLIRRHVYSSAGTLQHTNSI